MVRQLLANLAALANPQRIHNAVCPLAKLLRFHELTLIYKLDIVSFISTRFPLRTWFLSDVAYSLKSAFVFSQPAGLSSRLATFSARLIFNTRFLSEHNSYIVDKLKSNVCDENPESTKSSRVSRPYQMISIGAPSRPKQGWER